MARQELVDRRQALLDALGVVQPIDAHAEQGVGLKPKLAPYLLFAHSSTEATFASQCTGHSIEMGYGRTSVRRRRLNDGVGLAIDAALHERVHRVDEVVAVLLSVEADDARARAAPR